MRCRCCDSPDATWINYYEEYYCDPCLEAIEETVSEDKEYDLEEYTSVCLY